MPSVELRLIGRMFQLFHFKHEKSKNFQDATKPFSLIKKSHFCLFIFLVHLKLGLLHKNSGDARAFCVKEVAALRKSHSYRARSHLFSAVFN